MQNETSYFSRSFLRFDYRKCDTCLKSNPFFSEVWKLFFHFILGLIDHNYDSMFITTVSQQKAYVISPPKAMKGEFTIRLFELCISSEVLFCIR